MKYLYTYIVLAVIIYATWLPHPLGADDLPRVPHLDKLVHAVMMGGLVAAMLFDYRRSRRPRRDLTMRVIILCTAFGMAFSVLDETVQGLLPIGRPSDPLDILADWAGCLIAALTAPPAIRQVLK